MMSTFRRLREQQAAARAQDSKTATQAQNGAEEPEVTPSRESSSPEAAPSAPTPARPAPRNRAAR